MSIVEAALNKVKSFGQVPADRRGTERRNTGGAASAEGSARRHQQLEIDLDSIRREGMLPKGDAAKSAAEEFRRIKWPLIASALGKGDTPQTERGNLLLVTSAVPGEGKSFVSLNLAFSIAAERDCRVLLVDADPAKARITQLYGAAERAGLTELLSDDRRDADDLILDTNVPGLQFLPAGHVDSRSPELFASRRAENCLEGLAARNPDQMIVLDSPPLLATSEAQVLARTAGQVLLIVRADSTTQSALTHAIALLQSGAKVRCVLNQSSPGLFGGAHYYAYERR